ncbi:DNA polymerase V [Ectothiorhodospira mobilis]|uniref:DNA polymerase V n=1 Tax=Ectothiorhodospira mobilis TaxID=195064 RepID=A0A1I4S7S5_ECTMO|nr:translesion error-prone DNA polymerase V subunit UmuC [Ectothiorhodospira mobilis]SFM60545.1 DNA polymerase V [Ectothiorhodospira mobilis]
MSRSGLFALVDCNHFYAACERVFRPDLRHRPVVVLSNNDGCVVARSPEARALGIPMGVPVFQVRSLIRRHGVAVFSSNYALYADLSARVMQILEGLAPRVEVYSIDEAFLDLSGFGGRDLEGFGRELRETVGRWTGIPTCVGIAPTKTLSKLANALAKADAGAGGVMLLQDPRQREAALARMPVTAVWGVGRRLGARLQAAGIDTAGQLARAEPGWIRRRFSVVLERTVRELRGESCLDLDPGDEARQQVLCSRSFGERITCKGRMREAVSTYVARAAEKLRQDDRLARQVSVFIQTALYREDEPRYARTATGALAEPSRDIRVLSRLALELLDGIWKEGHAYAKAGVLLADLHAPGTWQSDLFAPAGDTARSDELMRVMDRINGQGRGRVWLAGQGMQRPWAMRRAHLSPAYTTRWDALPRVR